MKLRTIIVAASAAVAIATAAPASALDVGDKVTPNFEQAIPNIPDEAFKAARAALKRRNWSISRSRSA